MRHSDTRKIYDILATMFRVGFNFLFFFLCVLFSQHSVASQSLTQKQALHQLLQWQTELEQGDPTSLELIQRRLFVGRLIFKVERNADSAIRSEWVLKVCQSEIEIERQQAGSIALDFLEQLTVAQQQAQEPYENPLSFIRSFTEFSGIITAKTAEEFASSRAYINGNQAAEAEVWDADEAADSVEDIFPEITPELTTLYLQTPAIQSDPILGRNPNPSLLQMESLDPIEPSH